MSVQLCTKAATCRPLLSRCTAHTPRHQLSAYRHDGFGRQVVRARQLPILTTAAQCPCQLRAAICGICCLVGWTVVSLLYILQYRQRSTLMQDAARSAAPVLKCHCNIRITSRIMSHRHTPHSQVGDPPAPAPTPESLPPAPDDRLGTPADGTHVPTLEETGYDEKPSTIFKASCPPKTAFRRLCKRMCVMVAESGRQALV
jgi:hypothetical protein